MYRYSTVVLREMRHVQEAYCACDVSRTNALHDLPLRDYACCFSRLHSRRCQILVFLNSVSISVIVNNYYQRFDSYLLIKQRRQYR